MSWTADASVGLETQGNPADALLTVPVGAGTQYNVQVNPQKGYTVLNTGLSSADPPGDASTAILWVMGAKLSDGPTGAASAPTVPTDGAAATFSVPLSAGQSVFIRPGMYAICLKSDVAVLASIAETTSYFGGF